LLILAIETSTPRSSVGLATEHGLVAGADLSPLRSGRDRPRAHGEFLAPAIAFCLEQAGVGIGAVSGVAVGLGPGLYTGMRVGIATAAALAHARGLPTVGLASLDLLAFRARHGRRLVCSAVDARRGELFWAFYRPVHGGMQRVTEFRVGTAAKLAGEIEAVRDDVLCVGDGAVGSRGVLESTGAEVGSEDSAFPTAESLAALAVGRFLREEWARPEDLKPIYLRKADARIGWRNRGALFGGTRGAGGTTTTPERQA
jgi:tRNA threonylcarbamoyladenosine biosynthesis protein TsaB